MEEFSADRLLHSTEKHPIYQQFVEYFALHHQSPEEDFVALSHPCMFMQPSRAMSVCT
jgi:hypothetical protein